MVGIPHQNINVLLLLMHLSRAARYYLKPIPQYFLGISRYTVYISIFDFSYKVQEQGTVCVKVTSMVLSLWYFFIFHLVSATGLVVNRNLFYYFSYFSMCHRFHLHNLHRSLGLQALRN